MVHDVAKLGFGREAETYESSRPSYPPAAVDWLIEHLGIRSGATVVDLAAGTGKLTRLLVPTGAFVVAIEPVLGMRAVFRRSLASLPVVAATAEAMPLRGSSVDAACVAQAFHWFDPGAAFAELARVLRPSGRVGMVWNARDRSVDWVRQVWAILDKVDRDAPRRDHDNRPDSVLMDRPGFGPLHRASFHHEQVTTPSGMVDRFRGVSYVAALDAGRQSEVLAEVRAVLETHPDTRGRQELPVPYRVDCYWTERTSAEVPCRPW